MSLRIVWGQAAALLDRSRRISWIDFLVLMGIAGLVFGLADLSRQWTGELRPTVDIDLDAPWALPRYTFYSLSRGLVAYVFSLLFTLVYGYWAAKDHRAERLLIPLLDILQSIPVLSFLPVFLLGLVALFPHSNIGLELTAVFTIFTGQAWNMTFSYYHSLRSVPLDQREVATVYGFTWWQRLKWLELPFSAMGLVWNSMMSMAGGWFFLMINETFRLKDKDFRLPGLGSYMQVAVDEARYGAMLWAIVAMIAMIVALDQLLWRPVVVWAQKFRVEEGGQQEAATSWFLELLRRSRILILLGRLVGTFRRYWQHQEITSPVANLDRLAKPTPPARRWPEAISLLPLFVLIGALGYGAWKLMELLVKVPLGEWVSTWSAACWTLGRVLVAIALATLWTVPAGLAIGRSPRLSRLLQPVVQVTASFPAPMLFALVVAGLQWLGVSFGWCSIALMLLGTQWYILFNVIAGAMAVPADLQEAARSYGIRGWQRFRTLYGPAIFPYLVTGWVTAAGGAWNASIVAEYFKFKGKVLETWGLAARIADAADNDKYPLLAASTLVMSILVVAFNRTVWQRCYRLAEERYSLTK